MKEILGYLRDCSETRTHNLMKLSLRQMSNERLDQHRRFSLSDEWRGGSNNRFASRNSHGPEEEDGELLNKPLEGAPIV